MWPFTRRNEGLGRRGERLAARHLRRSGLKVLARNVRCSGGEIDLIALDRTSRRQLGAQTLAFVEVKTRSGDDYVEPVSAVNHAKQQRVRRAARQYLAHHDANGYHVRFDVVTIVIRPGHKPQIQHIPDAF